MLPTLQTFDLLNVPRRSNSRFKSIDLNQLANYTKSLIPAFKLLIFARAFLNKVESRSLQAKNNRIL